MSTNCQHCDFLHSATDGLSGLQDQCSLQAVSILLGRFLDSSVNYRVRSYCLSYIGMLTRQVQTDLQINEDEGIAYYRAAIELYQDNLHARSQMIQTYKSLPWIVIPKQEIVECIRVVNFWKGRVSGQVYGYIDIAIGELKKNVENEDELCDLGVIL